MTFILCKNDDRYPGIDPNMPKAFEVSSVTPEQAEWIAERISNHNAGCDYSWYVEGGEGDREN